MVYCDTSLFMRMLLPGGLQSKAKNAAEKITTQFGFVPVSSLARFETIQAIRFEAWRNKADKTKGIPAAWAETALNLFLGEIGSTFHLVAPAWENVFAQAELLSRTTTEKGWRTVDMLHVAAATASGVTDFYSFDREQNLLAKEQGLKTPLLAVAI